MKQIYLIFLILFLSVKGTLFSQPVTEHGQLWVDGSKLKDAKGKVVVLRGMSFGWHNWYYRFYNPNAVKWLYQDWGCSVLRLAIGAEPEDGYIDNPEWTKETLASVVEAAIKEGIYVIIDWHCHNIELDGAKGFFTEMAELYGEYPNVIYEIINEPDNEQWSDIKAYAVEIISEIRKIDPDNIILVGTPTWSQDVDVVADDPILGFNNIMYSLHFYAASHTQKIRDKAVYAIDKRLPVFVSECSLSRADGDGILDIAQFKRWMKLLGKNQISWVLWSVSDKDEASAVLKPSANSNGTWVKEDLSDSGLLARTLLRKHSLHRHKVDILVSCALILLLLTIYVMCCIIIHRKRL